MGSSSHHTGKTTLNNPFHAPPWVILCLTPKYESAQDHQVFEENIWYKREENKTYLKPSLQKEKQYRKNKTETEQNKTKHQTFWEINENIASMKQEQNAIKKEDTK